MRISIVIALSILIAISVHPLYASQSTSKLRAACTGAFEYVVKYFLPDEQATHSDSKTTPLLIKAIEKLLLDKKPWEFTVSQKIEFRAAFLDPSLTDGEQLHTLFQAIMKARLTQIGPLAKAMIKGVHLDLFEPTTARGKKLVKSNVPTTVPQYDTLYNRVLYSKPDRTNVRDLVILSHELEHAFQQNTNPIMYLLDLHTLLMNIFIKPVIGLHSPLQPLVKYRRESRAIGAQWEFVSRIPENKRNAFIKKLEDAEQQYMETSPYAQMISEIFEEKDFYKQGAKLSIQKRDIYNRAFTILGSEEALKEVNRFLDALSYRGTSRIALASLKNGHLTKQEFIKALEPIHGYDFHTILMEAKPDPKKVDDAFIDAAGLKDLIYGKPAPNPEPKEGRAAEF